MRKQDLLKLLVSLGKEFVRRGMNREARTLRVFYAELREGRAPSGNIAVRWDTKVTKEWMRRLRVPPFDNDYLVQMEGVPCLRCKPGKGGRHGVELEDSWPGGAKVRCHQCGRTWIAERHERPAQ